MKQLKDRENTLAKITITAVREVWKDKNMTENRPKVLCVNIDKITNMTTTCFKDNTKGHRELLAFIKKELYL
jgi:hypothetical protein